LRKPPQRSVSRSVSRQCTPSRQCSASRTRSADRARARGDSPCPYTPERVPVSWASPQRSLSRGSGSFGARARCNQGVLSNSRLSSSPSGWPGWRKTSAEVLVKTDRGDGEDVVQACTGVASNGSRDPSPSMSRTPKSFPLNQQATPQRLQQELRDKSPQSQGPFSRRESLPIHGTKAANTERVATSDIVKTPATSSPLPAAAVPALPLPGPESNRKNQPSRFSSPTPHSHEAAVAVATAAVARTLSAARRPSPSRFAEVPRGPEQQSLLDQSSHANCLLKGTSSSTLQSPCAQEGEQHSVERPSGSVTEAAAAAAAAAVAAANALGFDSEWAASPAGGIGLVQGPASLDPPRASSAGTRRQDPGRSAIYKGRDCIGTKGGRMCGSLSARGLASQGDAQARILRPQPPEPPLRKTSSNISARASVSPSPRRIASSNIDARERCAGRISALKSELDLLRDKTGTIRQQLQHFKASQSSLLSHSTAEVAELREPRFAGGLPEG